MSNKFSLQNQLRIPALVTLKNLMRSLTARLENGYCSITVANPQLITVIRFVSKSYTHPWKNFANKFRLVLHACEIFFSGIMCDKCDRKPNRASCTVADTALSHRIHVTAGSSVWWVLIGWGQGASVSARVHCLIGQASPCPLWLVASAAAAAEKPFAAIGT